MFRILGITELGNWGTRWAGCVMIVLAFSNGSAQSPRQKLLVDSNWLKQHINDPDIVLLHVGDPKEYEKEHLPGARFITQRDLAQPPKDTTSGHNMDHSKELMLELPTAEAMRAKLQSLGISDGSRIIVYYGNDWISPSTRIVFSLDWIGLGDRTSLLDGGMQEWKRQGGSVTAETPVVRPGKLTARATKPNVVDYNWVLANLKAPKVAIIDARTKNFYDGVDNGKRPGHIAGAGSLPFNTVADDNGKWKSAEELKVLFEKAGYKPGDTVVAYCHIGQQGTAVVFAARTLGYKVVLYDGSYTDWETHADAPIQ